MDENHSVLLSKIIDEFKLETICLPDLPENIMVNCSRVNRPGLQFVGFYDHYEQARIQIIGKAEHRYLELQPPELMQQKIFQFVEAS